MTYKEAQRENRIVMRPALVNGQWEFVRWKVPRSGGRLPQAAIN
jgi:hypothetical protein